MDNITITALLEAVENATVATTSVFADDAVLDATVPNWRFTVTGADAIREELSRWYADPGQFETIIRTPIEDGELVDFVLTWEEHGVPHAAHQAHIVKVEGDRIVSDTVFCGGRWPAALLAEMEAARHVHQ